MNIRKKNYIAQKVLAAFALFLAIVTLPALDFDITALIFLIPLCLYLLFTQETVMQIFRER